MVVVTMRTRREVSTSTKSTVYIYRSNFHAEYILPNDEVRNDIYLDLMRLAYWTISRKKVTASISHISFSKFD